MRNLAVTFGRVDLVFEQHPVVSVTVLRREGEVTVQIDKIAPLVAS